MSNQIIHKLKTALLLVAMVPCLAWAAPDSRKTPGDRKKPPQEAIDA